MSTVAALEPLWGVSLEASGSASVPEHDGWLTPSERRWLGTRRIPKRRADWRLGRWVGKSAVAGALGVPDLPPREVEILASPGGAPEARLPPAGGWPDVSLSLSHSGGVGFAAARVGRAGIGCDVEQIAPRSEAFVSDYFTPAEALWIRSVPSEHDVRATLLWSAKESALKALGEGLRLDTRSVVVTGERPEEDGIWRPMSVRGPAGIRLIGRWRWTPGFVWTVTLQDD